MSEVFEHNVGDHEDPLTGPTWIVGFLGAVLLAIVGLGLTALYYNADKRMVDQKIVEQTYPEFENLKAEQLAKLQGPPRKVEVMENDTKVGTVVIPIEDAMRIYAERAAKAQATQPDTRTHASAGASAGSP